MTETYYQNIIDREYPEMWGTAGADGSLSRDEYRKAREKRAMKLLGIKPKDEEALNTTHNANTEEESDE